MKAKITKIIGPNTVLCGKLRVRVPINAYRPLEVGTEIEVPDSEATKADEKPEAPKAEAPKGEEKK